MGRLRVKVVKVKRRVRGGPAATKLWDRIAKKVKALASEEAVVLKVEVGMERKEAHRARAAMKRRCVPVHVEEGPGVVKIWRETA